MNACILVYNEDIRRIVRKQLIAGELIANTLVAMTSDRHIYITYIKL